jgi:ABC-type glycerol-3-phosphate transport system substrate-binding protein
MRRAASLATIALVAVACSGGSEDDSADYFQNAATITATYESAAQRHFDSYLTALQGATAESGDAVFVDASKSLFAGLASEFGPAVAALDALTPPDGADGLHETWVSAGRALNDIFEDADSRLSALELADDVDGVLRNLPLADRAADYRDACAAVAAVNDSNAVIVCEPPAGG